MVKIFVGNLTDECSNEDLQALFGQYGEITDCEKLLDKPFGFVHMKEYSAADQAVRKLHGLAYKGKRLRAELSNSKPTKVFIGNVPHEASSEELREVFEQTGLDVHECDKVEGKGFGFAHVNSSKGFREINRVIRNLDKVFFKGRHLNIEISDDRRKQELAEQQYVGMAEQYGYSREDLGLDQSYGGGYGSGGGGSNAKDFCHDFQNGRCHRDNCRYIHCSPQEEARMIGQVNTGPNHEGVPPEYGFRPVDKVHLCTLQIIIWLLLSRPTGCFF